MHKRTHTPCQTGRDTNWHTQPMATCYCTHRHTHNIHTVKVMRQAAAFQRSVKSFISVDKLHRHTGSTHTHTTYYYAPKASWILLLHLHYFKNMCDHTQYRRKVSMQPSTSSHGVKQNPRTSWCNQILSTNLWCCITLQYFLFLLYLILKIIRNTLKYYAGNNWSSWLTKVF